LKKRDPPEIAVSPVAPFPRHHQCGDDLAADLGHPVKTGIRPAQKPAHARADDLRQEHLAFRLERHCAVEGDEHRRIARYSAADLRAHALS
jgi:hypothetical protein